MIQPIQFLWKQLNGPQIVGITQALFEWIKQSFDGILDYFKHFHISRATFSHLKTLGIINNLPLPTLTKYQQAFFFFTYSKEISQERGFSSLDDRVHGGKFSSLQEHIADVVEIDESTYRTLLDAVISDYCSNRSMHYLDKICSTLKRMSPNASYEFIYNLRNPGSITVDIGYESDWENAPTIVAIIDSLAKSSYYPEPIIDVEVRSGQRP